MPLAATKSGMLSAAASRAGAILRSLPPQVPTPDPAVTHPRDNGDAAFEGNGPLAGLLFNGANLKGTFPDNGEIWLPMKDDYGNWWTLLLSETAYRSNLFADPGHVHFQDEARNRLDAACAAAYKTQGWDYQRIIGSDSSGVGVYINQDTGALAESYHGRTLNPLLFQNDDGTWEECNPGSEAQYRALAGNEDFLKRARRIYFVPAHLPVPAKYQKDFDGAVWLAVDPYTRMACIIDTVHTASRAKAIWYTILGVLEIIIGIITIVASWGSAAPAGIALIVAGIDEIVTAWWDLADQTKREQEALSAARSANNLAAAGALIVGPGYIPGTQIPWNKIPNLATWNTLHYNEPGAPGNGPPGGAPASADGGIWKNPLLLGIAAGLVVYLITD